MARAQGRWEQSGEDSRACDARPRSNRADRGAPATQADERPAAVRDVADLRGRATCGIDEAAQLLGIGRSTAYAAARDGSLPTLRLSHRLLVPTAKLMVMLGLEREGE